MTDPNTHVPMGTDKEYPPWVEKLSIACSRGDECGPCKWPLCSCPCHADEVEAIRAVLAAAGFVEYDGDQFGFTVTKAVFGREITVDLRGVDLLPYNPGEGPRALLDDYATALTAAGYGVRTPGSMVIVSEKAGN